MGQVTLYKRSGSIVREFTSSIRDIQTFLERPQAMRRLSQRRRFCSALLTRALEPAA
jgi:hypothetical protein